MKKVIVCLAVVSAAFAARAGNVWFPNDTWSDKRNTAIITASMWSSEDGSQCQEISQNDDYIVNNGKTIRFLGSSFGGKSLTISNGKMVFDGGSGTEFPRDGLILEGGVFYNNADIDDTVPPKIHYRSIAGKVTVLSEASSPFVFRASQYAYRGTIFSGSLIGKENASFEVKNQYGGNSRRRNTCYVFMNAEGYSGKVNVLAVDDTTFSGQDLAIGFYLGATALPGTVAVGKGATFGAYEGADVCSVGTLSLARGSQIRVAYDADKKSNGSIVVSDRFSITGDEKDGVIDVLMLQSSGIAAGRKYPILSVPGDGLDEKDFSLTTVDGVFPGEFMLSVEPNGQGGRTLYAVACSVHLINSDNTDYKTASAVYSSAFTNAASWSDGKVPHAGADYFVNNGITLREIDDKTLDYVFPARNLTILGGGGGVSLICGSHSLEVTNLVVASGANFRIFSKNSNSPVIKGETLELQEGGLITFHGYVSSLSTIHSEVVGAGCMETFGETGTGSAKGKLELTGLNTNWTGRLKVNYGSSSKRGYPGDSNGYYTLYVSDERNLGGALEEFDFKALTLAGWSRFVPRNSLTLTPEYNRGIYVETNGSFNVAEADCVLTCNRTLTVNGAVYKEGKGTLVLGGALKFYDEQNDAATDVVPENAENSLNLRDGTLKIGAAKACDGLTIRVLNLAGKTPAIRIPIDAEQGSDLARYGLYNVKAGSAPFVLADGLETLPIAFDGISELPQASAGARTNGLITVHNSAVAAVREMLPSVIKPYSNVPAKRIEIPVEGEDATTFAVVSKHTGTIFCIR